MARRGRGGGPARADLCQAEDALPRRRGREAPRPRREASGSASRPDADALPVRLVSWLVHGVRFACEIAAVVAVVWWGWPVWGIVAGILVCVVWGAFVAPK